MQFYKLKLIGTKLKKSRIKVQERKEKRSKRRFFEQYLIILAQPRKNSGPFAFVFLRQKEKEKFL